MCMQGRIGVQLRGSLDGKHAISDALPVAPMTLSQTGQAGGRLPTLQTGYVWHLGQRSALLGKQARHAGEHTVIMLQALDALDVEEKGHAWLQHFVADFRSRSAPAWCCAAASEPSHAEAVIAGHHAAHAAPAGTTALRRQHVSLPEASCTRGYHPLGELVQILVADAWAF